MEPINYYPDFSDEERAELASRMTGAGPLRRFYFSSPRQHNGESDGKADMTSPQENSLSVIEGEVGHIRPLEV